jgi:hypothetical protein
VGDEAAGQPGHETGVDMAAAEADLDEGVEHVAVAAGGADPGVDDAR